MIHTLEDKNYREYTFKKVVEYKSVKNITVKIKEKDTIWIVAPIMCPSKVISEFVSSVEERLLDKYIQAKENRRFDFSSEGFMYIEGKKKMFIFTKREGKSFSKFHNDLIVVNADSESEIEKSVKSLIKRTYRPIWNSYLSEVEKMMNIKINKLTIKSMKTAWGVYHTNDREMVLNLSLACFEKDIQKYVIIHEAAHQIEPNHSDRFWKIVSKYDPDWKEHRKYMKQFNSK